MYCTHLFQTMVYQYALYCIDVITCSRSHIMSHMLTLLVGCTQMCCIFVIEDLELIYSSSPFQYKRVYANYWTLANVNIQSLCAHLF